MAAMNIKYNKRAMYPNGSVKKVKSAAVAPAFEMPLFGECLKNHAATLGAHALDGCCEFMASLAANPADPATFACVACGCHRNFHRRLAVSPPPAMPMPAGVLRGQPRRSAETPEDRLPAVDGDDSDSESDGSEYDDASPPAVEAPAHQLAPVVVQQAPPAYLASAPHMLLALNSGAPAGAPAQRLPALVSPATAPPVGAMPARKRFRTKFTPEQKVRMQELSERLGWRLQKRDEAIVDDCCRGIGVTKGVFKVWMHNNKHNYLGGHSDRRSASVSGGTTAAPLHPSAAPPPPNNMNGAVIVAPRPENGVTSPRSA